MLLLDLFCGAGGCSMGYSRAGFDIVGVDLNPMPRYPFRFVQADALNFVAKHGLEFDAIHASPPCQGYSVAKNNGQCKQVPLLVPEVRELLNATGKHYVIENVIGAPLRFPVLMCGAAFGLGAGGMDLCRHRLFECSFMVLTPGCQHRKGKTIGVYGNGTNSYHRRVMGRNLKESEKREAMGIDWMSRRELTQAIPPIYTEFIGRQLMNVLTLQAA